MQDFSDPLKVDTSYRKTFERLMTGGSMPKRKPMRGWCCRMLGTQQWMVVLLYRKRFSNGLSTAESVRAANLKALRRRRAGGLSTHPFYWGGFIAIGD